MSRRRFAALIALYGALLARNAIQWLFLADGRARAARVALYPRDWNHG
jgi:hypothetical protein